jgi:hypothetical protein
MLGTASQFIDLCQEVYQLLSKSSIWGYGRGWGKGGEMTQTLYAHMNKKKKKQHLTLPPLFLNPR